METRTKIIVAAIVIAVVGLALDWHLYLFFDRLTYLIKKLAEKCTAVEMARDDYQACRTVGYRDERCEHFRALVIEKAGECEAAEAALTAEFVRRRAQ